MEQIAGLRPVEEALRAGKRRINGIYLSADRADSESEQLAKLALSKGVPVRKIPRDHLDRKATISVHQGVLAVCAEYPYCSLQDILDISRQRAEDPFILIAANVQDPYNLGSLIRTAGETGVHGVIIPKRRAAPITPTVVKASAGATEYMQVARVTNLVRTVKDLKQRHVWVFAGEADGDSIYDVNLSGGIALVVGSEGSGVPRLLTETCDGLVALPSKGSVGSLNASVAGALLMYEVLRRRLMLDPQQS